LKSEDSVAALWPTSSGKQYNLLRAVRV